jgi:WD40 repeat protein
MESESTTGVLNFVVEKSTTVARRIFEHHVDIINWHLALLDDQNTVTVLDRDLKQIAAFDKVHEDKINQIKCLKEHVVTCSDDKTIKFYNKATGKLDLTLNCKISKTYL